MKVKGQRSKVKASGLRSNKGLSIIAVVIAVMLLLLFALSAASLISIRTEVSSDMVNARRAFYIAEAGLSVAKHTLYQNWSSWSNPDNFPSTLCAGGSFHAAVSAGSDPSTELIIAVTGTYADSTQVVEGTVSRYSEAMNSAIYANGTITVGGSATVIGDATQSDMPIPGLDVAAAIAQARANHLNGYTSRADGNYFQGDFSPKPGALNGVIFIDKYPSGSPADVDLASNISTNNGQPAFLIIFGELKITGTVVFHGLIYTVGTIDTFGGNMTLDGGLITTGNANLSGNSTASYNAAMVITSTTSSLLTGENAPEEKKWRKISP